MARTQLDALVTEKALHFVSTQRNADLLDMIGEDKLENAVQLKNVCAKVSAELAAEIDQVAGLLVISKRRFLEAAFVDAIAQAHQIMADEGVFQSMETEEIPQQAARLIHVGDK